MARAEDGGESGDGKRRYRRAALEQPLRRRIAERLGEVGEASAGELAAELGTPVGRVAYHLRVLHRLADEGEKSG